ncbi:PTS lactose/cellobiose transporter subunit IIA [Clostridium intestinale]|uniref:PTS system lactose/cellobiose-specific transporter subunit IIA n=2 Tax=Clostridium intestinale TaxID=36845 RepID=U2NPW4_9CLOT|nr:PTS lactose/cellobiose transporter subunit IIA [Clostridium intestinale]ERK30901.1 PTS system lactose/cellobiose-specific transporter subunit IIA [Clostridium intestinale URNW]QLY81395.1 PTS lactose/cellobiose transporter subunit IIA [Clostridium intestinale]
MNELEQQVVEIISTAGESKSKAFEALKKVKTKEFAAARKLLQESREIDIEAHKIQTKLITAEMRGGEDKPEIGLLMVHAQDHYMTAQLARDLIETLIEVFDNGEE